MVMMIMMMVMNHSNSVFQKSPQFFLQSTNIVIESIFHCFWIQNPMMMMNRARTSFIIGATAVTIMMWLQRPSWIKTILFGGGISASLAIIMFVQLLRQIGMIFLEETPTWVLMILWYVLESSCGLEPPSEEQLSQEDTSNYSLFRYVPQLKTTLAWRSLGTYPTPIHFGSVKHKVDSTELRI